jgi:hypothetical protein
MISFEHDVEKEIKYNYPSIAKLLPKLETVRTLFQSSGNECFFPKCKKKLLEDDGYLRGEICLIESNIKGESCFNPKMSDEQRINFNNLIMLCHWHHFKVDNNKKYTIDKLQNIKLDYMTLQDIENFQISDEMIEKTIQQFQKYYSVYRLFKHDQKKSEGKFKILQDLSSMIGVTICKKCGTRTKYKKIEKLDSGDVTLGYTVCPKCGNRENWTSGDGLEAIGAQGF